MVGKKNKRLSWCKRLCIDWLFEITSLTSHRCSITTSFLLKTWGGAQQPERDTTTASRQWFPSVPISLKCPHRSSLFIVLEVKIWIYWPKKFFFFFFYVFLNTNWKIEKITGLRLHIGKISLETRGSHFICN